ncbi:hypothetical protein Acor_61650 [Acrocarpospora corrugata]|uniref:Uncharacterized protein n=1 Tax=Acrocarpospora corrugata TaxID=35763 RepID=A0A5M3W6Z0_9ACTN|nr:hypothetical protein [Acrocarpospora corrugata]GES04099.1 hypothetical protein Acor_61650 [Acrocarpospora corrugata]
MIIYDPLPPVWTVSWFRGYDLGVLADIPPPELLATGMPPDAEPFDVGAHTFFDLQARRLGHFAKIRLAPIEFSGVLRLPHGELPVSGSVRVHILAHASGFIVIRPTLHSANAVLPRGHGADLLNQLERASYVYDYPLRWHVSDAGDPVTGGVRSLMNWVYLDLTERARGRADAPPAAWAVEGMKGCDRLHEMSRKGELAYPFPVSFGPQFELVLPKLDRLVTAEPSKHAEAIAQSLLYPAEQSTPPKPVGSNQIDPDVWWFVGESKAALLTSTGRIDDDHDAIDPDRTQLMEFLALRRTTLTCVQRDTQRVLTERGAVSRGQVERWQHIVASTSDDYVLDGRIGQLLAPLLRHNLDDVRIRDITGMELQVRQNLAWFQQRMDTLSEWTGGLVGAAVGSAAMVLSLQEVVKVMLAKATGVEVDKVLNAHGAMFALIMFLLVCLSFVLALAGIRWVTSRLRPFHFRTRRRRHPAAAWRSRKA